MMGWIRNARLSFKTGLVIIVIALAVWAVIVYVNLRDFVPEELTRPPEEVSQAAEGLTQPAEGLTRPAEGLTQPAEEAR